MHSDVVEGFGALADDFVLSILLSKAKFLQSRALPFVHAHALELSAKAAYYTVRPTALQETPNHGIRSIYDVLSASIENFSALLPKASSYDDYKKVWLKGPGPHVLSSLPPPNELFEWEVCYFIDNIVDLKYGYTKKMEPVSPLLIATPNVNPRFAALFKACRLEYATAALNKSAIEKGVSIFGGAEATRKVLDELFGQLKNG